MTRLTLWPAGRDYPIKIAEYSQGIVRTALRGNFFLVDGAGCGDLLHAITSFATHICRRYEAIVSERVMHADEDHSPAALSSWTINDLHQFFSYSMQKFKVRLVDAFALQIERVLPCTDALKGIDWLREVYVDTAVEWRKQESQPVLSRRARKRRSAHLWTPRRVDLVAIIDDYFR